MFGYYYGIDSYYLILVLPAILFSLWAQMKVNSTFSRYQRQRCYSGYTGAQIARRILDENGLQHVRVERVSGSLTDHYDPRSEVVRLSESVYGNASVAAVGVAAHETGHAIQHAYGYTPLAIRNTIIPITNLGSRLSMPLILLGLILNSSSLLMFGIIAFSMVTLFQLITLPVEFNASNRAMRTLSAGVLDREELYGARQVLTAAALTYVAALLVSAMQLLRLLLIFGNNNRRR